MHIETLALGQLQTNCYLVWDTDTSEGIIIDPGDAAEFIAEKVQSLNFTPTAIVATHGHFDHNLAAGELQMILSKFQGTNHKKQINSKVQISNSKQQTINNQQLAISTNKIPYFIHKADLFLLKQINKSARHWFGTTDERPLPETITYLKEGDTLKVGKYNLKVIETPGHTPGSICLFTDYITPGVEEPFDKAQGGKTPGVERKKSRILFSGDTLFSDGIGRYDFSYSSREKLDVSLKRLIKLPKYTIVYPGHGKKTTIQDEKDNVSSFMFHAS